MPYEKEELKKKEQMKLEEMQKEIDNFEAAEAEESVEEKSKEDSSEDNALLAENEKLIGELAERDDKYKRLQADFENFRRRTRQEKEELSAVVTQLLLKDMLPLLDNFERALLTENNKDGFFLGIEMIYKQLFNVLKEHGLEKIDVENAKFDPNYHQAVLRVQDAEKEDDAIAGELQKGYMVKGKVIRPSMVQVVSN